MESYIADPNGPGGLRCEKITIKASSDDHAIEEAKSFAKSDYFVVWRAGGNRAIEIAFAVILAAMLI